VLRGAIAAALTPLREGGARLDEDAFGPYCDFLRGLDGVLALGTTGEGILLAPEERRRVTELFLAGGLNVIAHCGAQSTVETVELAEHAAAAGVDGVAVIAPPYFSLDDDALLAHFVAAAAACAPTPFYVYEFARASGYAVPLEVLARLRELAPNLAGLKVSDSPWEAFAPYLVEGLDVFVGPEAPAVRDPDGEEAAGIGELRAAVERFPRHAALKRIVARRGVPIRQDVRAPLRGLTDDERTELDRWLESS
jgi:dihydrodipicolinate synthase/N-acetylneuraminate lyase